MIRLIKTIYHLLVAAFSVVWFGFPARKLTVIGVTGTDGKTTTTTLIYEILKEAGVKASMISSVHAVIAGKSYNTGFHVTTPNAFWVQKYLRQAVDHKDTHMVLEVTSHGLAQHRVFGIPFAVGVITNVTHEHLDWHKTFEHYLLTKLSLLTRARIAVINRDDADLYTKAMPFLRRKKVITYGIRHDAKVTPKLFPFKTPLPGLFNRYNCLAAIAATSALGVPAKTIREALAAFVGISGRMETVVTTPFQVIVDFAHTPNAIDKALRTARSMTRKKLIHVFGSAGLRDASKRPLMGEASSRYANVIVLTEEDYRTESVEKIMDEIQQGIEGVKAVYRYPNRGQAIAFALQSASAGDVVIITGKGHEQSLCRGTKEFPWSDQREVLKIVNKLK
jgi:UDP-N-acetylmuramoyl-L-alanyl-D-glutamate--2,6-diaminopimelate ligase